MRLLKHHLGSLCEPEDLQLVMDGAGRSKARLAATTVLAVQRAGLGSFLAAKDQWTMHEAEVARAVLAVLAG